jgi:ParB/RepB/Spo0J family partition protein
MSVATVKLSQIRPNPAALRAVNRESEKYVQLVDSVRNVGVLNAVSIREMSNPSDPDNKLYELVDGLHRFSAACDAGLEEINATVTQMNDAEVEDAQIIANIHKIDTRPVEYSKALHRMMARSPTLTKSELAARLAQSPAWLDDRLSLSKLHPSVATLVDEGKIVLSNAYALAKLKVDEQPNFLDRAITQTPSEFVPQVNARVKELRDAQRQGRDPNPQFVPQAHIRKMSLIKEEIATGRAADTLALNLTPKQAFQMALSWALHMDPVSVREATEEYTARKAAEAASREARKAERDAKKKDEALQVVAAA